jgi:alpha-amylase
MIWSFVMSNHSHRTHERNRLELNTKIMEILRTVPYENGFHFYTAPGKFTYETATSLESFEKKLQTVPADSLNFHFQRGDFQKWVKTTLSDGELAHRLNSVSSTLPPKELRKELLTIVQTRITELRRELPHQLSHSHS